MSLKAKLTSNTTKTCMFAGVGGGGGGVSRVKCLQAYSVLRCCPSRHTRHRWLLGYFPEQIARHIQEGERVRGPERRGCTQGFCVKHLYNICCLHCIVPRIADDFT